MAKLSVSQAMSRAKSLQKKRKTDEARQLYESILAAFPQNMRVQKALAQLSVSKPVVQHSAPPKEKLNALVALYNQGKLADVIETGSALIKKFPTSFVLWNILGAANAGRKQWSEAEQCFREVSHFEPDYADAHNNLGNVLKEQGKLDEAVASYTRAQMIESDNADIHYNLGTTLQKKGKLDEAVASYTRALQIRPDYVKAHCDLGGSLKEQGKLDEAVASYTRALQIKPDYAEAHNNLGNALQEQGKLDEAAANFTRALQIKPDYAEAHNNLGDALREQGKLDEAVASYTRALQIKPDYAKAKWNMSLVSLLQGNLRHGFELMETRLYKSEASIRAPRNHLIWDGKQIIMGAKFHVYEEQGLGDIIQFSRYLPLLKAKGAIVTFHVKAKLHSLLSTLNSDIELSASAPPADKLDFEAPLMSLPHLLGTQLDTVPAPIPYLSANEENSRRWRDKLSSDKFKIGICWQGSKLNVDVVRSFPLALFEDIFNISNIELISLHKGEGEDQLENIAFDVTTLGPDFDAGPDAFCDTAAVMMNCDLIMTSDTAVAHLAGALGCNTWVILKSVPDWRWMMDVSNSPWYPNMTLYRQKNRGDWEAVLNEVQHDLRALLDQKGV